MSAPLSLQADARRLGTWVTGTPTNSLAALFCYQDHCKDLLKGINLNLGGQQNHLSQRDWVLQGNLISFLHLRGITANKFFPHPKSLCPVLCRISCMHKEKTFLFISCNRVTTGVQEKDCVCYFWSQLLFGASLSVIRRMVFINGFHHRWLFSGLLCPHGLRLCLNVWFVVFVLSFIYIDICCPPHHGHIKVLEAKYNFCNGCHKVLLDLVSTAENTVCKNSCISLEIFSSTLKKMSYLLTPQVHLSFSPHFCPCKTQV